MTVRPQSWLREVVGQLTRGPFSTRLEPVLRSIRRWLLVAVVLLGVGVIAPTEIAYTVLD